MKEIYLYLDHKIYLFEEFPYAYDDFNSVEIIDGVFVDIKPSHELVYSCDVYKEDKIFKPYHYVLPTLNLNLASSNACIKISSNIEKQDNVFWILILAFRLIKNYKIHVSGSFDFLLNDYCSSPTLYNIVTQINIDSTLNQKISSFDLKIAGELVKRIIELLKRNDSLSNSIILFTQVSTGRSSSSQMMYLSLWSSLEGLLGSSGEAQKLSDTWKFFFKDSIENYDIVSSFIKDAYTKNRNPLSHGNNIFWENYKNNRDIVLDDLYEVVKLTLLGFMGLTDENLNNIFVKSSNKTRKNIENNKAGIYFLNKLKIKNVILNQQK